MQIVEEIKKLIKNALKELGIDLAGVEIELEHPADLVHGDYSSNLAMIYAKMAGENPRECAERIRAKLPSHEYIGKTEVAGAGFINFFLSEAFFSDALSEVLERGDEWGDLDMHKGKSMLIEHSSPNLFKPFHIGHLVNNTYGEVLARLMRASGAHVTTISFPSDISPGIAKAVWGIMDANMENEFDIEELGEAYVRGVRAYEDDAKAKKRIDEINANLYKRNEKAPEWHVYERGRDISLSYFEHITQRLGSHFDDLIFESDAEKVGKDIVKRNTPGVFEESAGAIIFRGSKYGLFDNVYINSAGFGTYLAKDTGLLGIKFDKYDFDISITVTDIEQKQHFELVKKSAELIKKEFSEKSLYLQHGRLALTTGAISSRSGDVPLAIDIIELIKQEAMDRMKENKTTADERVAEQVAIGAIKYAIARVCMGKNMVFDMKKSLSFEGDSGPYLQYTYARCKSILSKNKIQTSDVRCPTFKIVDVERLIYRFPEVVARAAIEYAPHYIANYLNDLASIFNSWYAQEKILDGSKEQDRKLAVTMATAVTLKNGLRILGIQAPGRM